MADPIFFNCYTEDLYRAKHNFGTHTFKVALTLSQPSVTNTSFTDLAEIAAGNGYTAGGNPTVLTISRTGSVTRVFATDVTFTATGNMAPFRFATVYNDTTVGKPLVCMYDYGVTINLQSTDGHVIDFDASLGWLEGSVEAAN